MEKKVVEYIEREGILRGVQSLLVAISGGPDSMALADLMMRKYGHLKIALIHLNHGLREAADREEAFIRSYGQERQIPVYSKKIDIRAEAAKNKIGIEEAGRLARYGYFRQVMAAVPAQVVLTAHHQDDQAETVLANLLRGSGLEGLAAMAPFECGLGRPFLAVDKEEILSYCRGKKIPYFLDETNGDVSFRRNRIRHRLMPSLEEYNPKIREALCRLAALCREDNEALKEAAAQIFTAFKREEETGLSLGADELTLAPPAIQSRLVRMAAEAVCPYQVLDYEKTHRVLSLSSGSDLAFGDGLFIRRRHERLFFSAIAPVRREEDWEVEICLSAKTAVPALGWEIEVDTATEMGREDGCAAYFPQAWFDEAPVFRKRREGDWFPLEKGGRKKLKEFFIDEKIPREERDALPLLAKGSRVLWLPEHRIFHGREKGPFYVFRIIRPS